MKHSFSSSTFRNPIVLILCTVVLFFVVICGMPASSGTVNSLTAVEASYSPTAEPKAAPSSVVRTSSATPTNSIAALFVPVITATKTASPSALVNPGDTITYTVTISNASMDATNVNFNDTIDANTTLVGGSVKASPVAVNDSYTATGNVRIQVPAASGVLANDFLGLNPTATITAFDATSAQGGNVTVNADGSFSYNPPAGYEGTDTFTYTLTNTTGSNSGTVTITISGMIWFINNNATACTTLAAGCGRLTNPFSTLASFAAINNGTGNNPAANDNIFIYTGTTDYNAVLTLLAGQRLIGQGAGATLAVITGLTPPPFSDPLPATGGTRPNITSSGVAITLGSGNTIRGLNVGDTTTTDIAGTSFGTLMIGEVDLNGTGQALNLATGTLNGLGVTTATFTTITSTNSPGAGISLTTVAGGLTATATSITNPTTQGINVNTSSATLNFGNTTANQSGGTGVNLTTNTGTITFGTLNIAPDANARGLNATENTQTITSTGGAITTTNAVAVEITKASGTTPLQVSQASVSASGGTNGIILTRTSGSFTVTGTSGGLCGGQITVNAVGTPATVTPPNTGDCTGGTIQNTSGAGLLINTATNVSLTRVRVLNCGTDGINVSNINGFTLSNSNITDSSGVAGDRGIEMGDFSTGTAVNGTINVTNSTIGPTPHDNFGVGIGSGTSTWNITGTLLDDSQLNSGFNFEIRNATVSSFLMDGCVLRGQFADGLQMNPASGVSATITSATIQNCTIRDNNIGLDLNHDGTGTSTYKVLNNTFLNQVANTINFFSSALQAPATGGTFNGRFVGNVIGNAAIFNSGGGIGIRININGGAAARVLVDSNVIRQIPNGRGIEIVSRNGTAGTDATVTNNQVNTDFVPTMANGGFSLANIFLQSNCVTVCNTLRADVRGNTVPNTPPTGELISGQLAALETGASTFQLVDNGAVSPNATQELTSQNTGNCQASAGVALIAGPLNLPPAAREIPDDFAKIEGSEPATANPDSDIVLHVTHGEIKPDDQVQKLKQSDIDWMLPAAIERWRQAGISLDDLARLQTVRFELANLGGDEIARAENGVVKVDELAANYGWFVDLTIFDDNEFTVGVPNKELQTTEASLAHNKMDLLTVVMRGLGVEYLKGRARVPKKLRPLMEATLSPSVRRIPNSANIGFIIPEATNDAGNAQPNDSAAGASSTTSQTNGQPQMAQNATVAPQSGETINVGPINTLPVGESVIITFQVTVNAVGTLPVGTTQVCNQGTVTAAGGISVLTDDPAVAGTANPTCTTLNVADVAITKSAGTSPICSTSNLTFTLNYINNGPAAAASVLVSDAMPAGTSLVSVSTPATWTRSDSVAVGGNGTITFTKASSANADTATFTIVVSIDGSVANDAVILNQATVSSTTADTTPANNTSNQTSTTVKKPPTTATVGGPQTICALGTTTGLGGNTPTIGTGTWSVQSGGTGTFSPNATTPNATFTHLTGTGPVVLRWTISNAPCPDSFAEVTVTVKVQPTATVGGPQTICALGTTTGLGGNTPVEGTGTWTIVTAGVTGTFTPNANAPNATFTHVSGGIGTTITLRWTVSNAPCTDATADVAITIKSQPVATVGGPQTICAGGTTAGLGGNTPAAGETGTWSIVTAGITGTFTPNANAPNATFTHATGATTPFVLRWTVTNAPCTPATADVSITLQPAPIATVGGPQTICELGTTAGLGGNTPITGETGTWTIVTAGVTGTFTPNANAPNATFTHTSGAAGSTFTLRWTVNNATCGQSAQADVVITVRLQPTATVGGPQTICALGTTTGLGGNTPAGGATGMWSIVTGGATGTFNPSATTPNATFTHLTGTGVITLRWTVSNAPCTAATADVLVTITQPPTTATVGGPQTICALGTTAGLGGNAPTVGTGTWSVQSGGTGTFSPNANDPNATFTHTGGVGPVVLRWTISNPPCPDSFAQVTITITQSPSPATVGANQTICALGTTAGLGGNTPSSGTGTWTVQSGGTGTFSPNANTPNATFTHLTGTGPIVLRWTIANPPCPDSFAELTITITPTPTATAGGPQTICALGTTAGLGGNTPTGGATGMWSIVTGGATGTFNPSATTPNATFTHLTGTGMITLRWTVSNAPCPSAMADVIITITQPPTTATAGPDQIIPPNGTTAGLGGNTPVVGTGMWTIVTPGATGTFNPNATTPNATWTHATGSGMVVLRWTISNPPCPDSFDEVTIQIGIPPTITCPANITQSTDPGVCQAVVTFTVTSTGLPTPTVTCMPPSGSVFPKGTTTVNCTASNGVPPDASCSFTVTINDTEPPVITCPANVTVSTDPNVCTAVVTFPDPTVTDNCPPPSGTIVPKKKKNKPTGAGGFTPTCNPPSGSTFPKGTTTVNCQVSDASGNTAMCSFTVTVNDTQNPSITCPANITQSTDPNLCSAVVNYPAPTVSDNCPGVGAPSCTPPAGTAFPKGTTTVNCTVADASGNTANCSFTVTINDTQKPTITCPANITATIPSGSCVVVNYPPPVATDNCPGVTVNCVPPSGSCFSLGTTTVTCTATDASGNTKSCSFTVTTFDVCIQDDSNPAIVLLFNSTTGQYVFCCDGTVYTGTGTIRKKGSLITLNHNPPDRRLTANVTLGGTGNATLQSPPGTLRCVITDRDVTNNTCNCAIPIN